MQQMQKIFRKIGKVLKRFLGRVKKGSPLDIAILIAAIVLALTLIVILIFTLTTNGKAQQTGASTSQLNSDSIAADDSYDKDAASINVEQYDGTILIEDKDAGKSYLDETLFIGDSNTARMNVYGDTTLANNLGIVGMGIQHVTGTPCVYFSGYSSPVYVAKAVELMQPKRIIITFGTNNTNSDAETFKKQYSKALDAIDAAYPYADIIINAIPPVAKQRSYPDITMKTIDSFNLALVELAREKGYQFINSSEALRDASSGYAKSGYMVSDGIHLSETGMDALMKYIRTHPHDTQDTRPALKAVPTHTATPETLFVPASSSSSDKDSSSSSSSSSSTVSKVAVTFSIQGDTAGGTLSGTLSQAVAPGGTCATVSVALKDGYTAVWGCTEGSISNNTGTSVSFTVPAYTQLEKISVWVTLSKASCTHAQETLQSDTATCTGAGTKTYVCQQCGIKLREEASPAKGHSGDWVSDGAGNLVQTCTVCGTVNTKPDPNYVSPTPPVSSTPTPPVSSTPTPPPVESTPTPPVESAAAQASPAA